MGVSTDMSTLVGRDRELDLVRTALADARESRGGVLVFTGEPGSGKTSLLSAARAIASDFDVVVCAGVEWEAELPFSGLHELLGPLLGHRAALPEPQRIALEGALGLTAVDSPQQLNVYAGALSLVLEVTRARPVLLVVDDFQWIDSATAQVLAFMARRIGNEPIAMLIASRPGTELQSLDRSPVELTPLDESAVEMLASRHLRRPLHRASVRDLAAASAGNPLAIVESVRRFGDELGLRGTLLDHPLPVGELIERGFADRLAPLSQSARAAMGVVVAAVGEDLATLQAALALVGLPASSLLEPERAGVLRLQNARATFAHPLLRALVHRQTQPDWLRACHRALAQVSGTDEDLRAWHAASGAVAADEPIAAGLAAAAERFQVRGGYLAAAQALARAAQLTPDADRRAERLTRGGRAALYAGQPSWAHALLTDACEAATDPRTSVRANLERVRAESQVTPDADRTALALAVADSAVGVDDDTAVVALGRASGEALLAGLDRPMLDAIDRITDLVSTADLSAAALAAAELSTGSVLVLAGKDDQRRGAALLRSAAARRLTPGGSGALGEALVWVEEFAVAQEYCRVELLRARSQGDSYALTGVLCAEGYRLVRTGDWRTGAQHLAECIAIADAAEFPADSATAWGLLALVQAATGESGGALDTAVWEQLGAQYGYPGIVIYAGTALGLAELGRGRGAEAATQFERARAWTNAAGQTEPCVLSWPADLVDAYALAGDRATARERLEEFRERSLVLELPWARANVARLDGLLAADDAYESHFERSLDLFAQTQAPFDRARAQLAFGQRLRRSRRKTDAREQLEAALAEFDRLGARPWAEMARRELGASAPSIRKGPEHDPDALTPQERQVAGLVADGASNKEVAGAMFLSPKTIETHLSRIYRKLGVSSRTQLAAQMRDASAARP